MDSHRGGSNGDRDNRVSYKNIPYKPRLQNCIITIMIPSSVEFESFYVYHGLKSQQGKDILCASK